MNDKVIYLKDALKDKTPKDIIDMLPFMVCIEEIYPDCIDTKDNIMLYKAQIERNSYEVIGVSKKSILLGEYIMCENDDDFGFSPYRIYSSYKEIFLDKLDNVVDTYDDDERYKHNGTRETKFVFCHECSPNQKYFLVRFCDIDEEDVISGYEAYHLIKEKTDKWQKKKEKANKEDVQ